MADYKLHCFGESGNAYKVALMMRVCGLEYEPVILDFMNGVTRTPEWRGDANEMGEAPVLEHKGKRLTQSAVILDYLSEQTGKFGWTSEDERRDVYRWILFDNHKFTGYMAPYRFLTHFLKQKGEAVDFLFGRLKGALDVVEGHLKRHDWIALDRPTIADFSFAGYVYYDDELHFDLADWPAIDAWRQRIRAMDGWAGPYDLMARAPAPRKTG